MGYADRTEGDLPRLLDGPAPLSADAFPVVELTTKTRPHKTYGSIKGPWFNIVGWATVEDVKSGKKGGAKAKAPTKVETEAELNDELPVTGDEKRPPGVCAPDGLQHVVSRRLKKEPNMGTEIRRVKRPCGGQARVTQCCPLHSPTEDKRCTCGAADCTAR